MNKRPSHATVVRPMSVESDDLLTGGDCDDSPWTREELQALAWECVKHDGWDEYDDLPEKGVCSSGLTGRFYQPRP